MSRVMHFAHPGYRAACGTVSTPLNSTVIPGHVTCGRCPSTLQFAAAAEFWAVVDMLAYPKEDHPCLIPPTSTPTPTS